MSFKAEKKFIFYRLQNWKKSSVQGLNFCPPTGTSPNWHLPQLALPQLALFANFFNAIENFSPPTAGTPIIYK